MKKEKTIDVISIIKERLHLLKVGFIPLIFILVGIYLLLKGSVSVYMSDRDMLMHNIGLILAIVGILSLITVFIVRGMRTFKQWQVVKKQKAYFKSQQHPRAYKIIFFVLIILVIIRTALKGVEGWEQTVRVFNWVIVIAIIWSIIKLVEKKK